LLSLPHKKSPNAYNISTLPFASSLGIVDAAARLPRLMSAHCKELLHGLACLVLPKAQAVGGRAPLTAKRMNLRVIS
jgi:hypothetical protein